MATDPQSPLGNGAQIQVLRAMGRSLSPTRTGDTALTQEKQDSHNWTLLAGKVGVCTRPRAVGTKSQEESKLHFR